MPTEVKMDGAEYKKYLALERKLQECDENFTIEKYFHHNYYEDDGYFKIHTDNDAVKALNKEVKSLKKKNKKRKKSILTFKRNVQDLRNTDTQKKVVELMTCL